MTLPTKRRIAELLLDAGTDADQALLDAAAAQDDATDALADASDAQDDATAALADTAALEAEVAIVAGPQTLAGTFLTKPVLRKVLTVAAGPDNTTLNVAHGITAPTRILGCIIQLTNGTNHLCFGQGGNSWASAISVAIDGTNVDLTTTGDFSTYAGSIILLYTLVA